MDIDDFFNFDTVEPEPIKMSKDEFVEKTKKLLLNIYTNYSQSWVSKALKENEFPDESICDECTGCGTFKKENGEDGECFQDRQEGQCYHRFMDAEGFGLETEVYMDDVYELLGVDEVTN